MSLVIAQLLWYRVTDDIAATTIHSTSQDGDLNFEYESKSKQSYKTKNAHIEFSM